MASSSTTPIKADLKLTIGPKSFRMAGVTYRCFFTQSEQSPTNTDMPASSEIGDVHLDDSVQTYYVYSPPLDDTTDTPIWRSQPVGSTFTHPLWNRGPRYTWSISDYVWKQARLNAKQGNPSAFGVRTRKGKRKRTAEEEEEEEEEREEMQKRPSKAELERKTPPKSENDIRWEEVIDLFKRQAVRHPEMETETIRYLKLLSKHKLHYHDELSSATSIQPGSKWSLNGVKYELAYTWEDVLATPIATLDVADRGLKATGQFTMAEVVDNYTASSSRLTNESPWLAMINVFPNSVKGFQRLGFAWDSSPTPRYAAPDGTNSSTFTPAAYLTNAHFDGSSYAQNMAQLEGTKLWITWPATKENILECRRDTFIPFEPMEHRFEMLLDRLQDPMVYLARPGDSFMITTGLIHACIAITTSVHFGTYFWMAENLEPAMVVSDTLKEKWVELEEEERNRLEVREDRRRVQDQWGDRRRTLYKEWKDGWDALDIPAWNWIVEKEKQEGSSEKAERIKAWVTDVTSFLKTIEPDLYVS